SISTSSASSLMTRRLEIDAAVPVDIMGSLVLMALRLSVVRNNNEKQVQDDYRSGRKPIS
ncbi:MAG: hypothetical protein OXI19_03445, partial [Gemmatimonadota bacterium]|nr:hypothetical protein [Gemmatimonadota bacterium]